MADHNKSDLGNFYDECWWKNEVKIVCLKIENTIQGQNYKKTLLCSNFGPKVLTETQFNPYFLLTPCLRPKHSFNKSKLVTDSSIKLQKLMRRIYILVVIRVSIQFRSSEAEWMLGLGNLSTFITILNYLCFVFRGSISGVTNVYFTNLYWD